jgi:cell division protein FtsQ
MPRVLSATPKLQERRQEARRERRATWVRRGAWSLAAVVPLGLLAWVLLWSPLLGLHKVDVSGEHRLTPAEVRAAVEVPRGTPLARVDTAGIARRVRGLAEVASVTVTRSWPHSLHITVVERTAAVAVRRGRGYDLLDETGVRFDTATKLPRGVLLLEADDDSRTAALQVVRGLPAALRRVVWVVRASSPHQVSLVLRGNRVLVWGSPDQPAAKGAAALALLKLPGRHYDVSSPSVVTRS